MHRVFEIDIGPPSAEPGEDSAPPHAAVIASLVPSKEETATSTSPVVAFVSDLMDRSRLASSVPDVVFALEPDAASQARAVVVDLARFEELLGDIRAAAPRARIVAFGPHVDDALLRRARSSGVDVVLPRSRFFRDPVAALAVEPDDMRGSTDASEGGDGGST